MYTPTPEKFDVLKTNSVSEAHYNSVNSKFKTGSALGSSLLRTLVSVVLLFLTPSSLHYLVLTPSAITFLRSYFLPANVIYSNLYHSNTIRFNFSNFNTPLSHFLPLKPSALHFSIFNAIRFNFSISNALSPNFHHLRLFALLLSPSNDIRSSHAFRSYFLPSNALRSNPLSICNDCTSSSPYGFLPPMPSAVLVFLLRPPL